MCQNTRILLISVAAVVCIINSNIVSISGRDTSNCILAPVLPYYPFKILCQSVISGVDYNSSLTVDKIIGLCNTDCFCTHGARGGGKCGKIPGKFPNDVACLCDYSKPKVADKIENPIPIEACRNFAKLAFCGTPLQETAGNLACNLDCSCAHNAPGKCRKLPWNPKNTYCVCGNTTSNSESLVNPADGSLVNLVTGAVDYYKSLIK